jgi:hypothetical protein
LPGSIRSGENASEKSVPATSPEAFSSSGRTTSSVVPGYVVDSSDTKVPGRSSRPAVAVAARTALRSGPSASDSGVGTQIAMTSAGPATASSVVARNPWFNVSATSASVTSSTWDRPAISPATTFSLVSRPVTWIPTRTAWTASGRPT